MILHIFSDYYNMTFVCQLFKIAIEHLPNQFLIVDRDVDGCYFFHYCAHVFNSLLIHMETFVSFVPKRQKYADFGC